MRNLELAELFVNGNGDGNGSHLFIENNVMYSYGYHFPIAVRLSDGNFIVNKDRCSMTTSTHQNYVRRELEQRGQTTRIIKLDTKGIQGVIKEGIKTKNELVAWGV